MYFPYLRGRQNELLAVQELANRIAVGKNVFPIIEPCNSNTAFLKRAIANYNEAAMPFVLIVNPQVGKLRKDPSPLDSLVNDGKLPIHSRPVIGYIISQRTTAEDVQAFLNKYSNEQVSLIHRYTFDDPHHLNTLVAKHGGISNNVFIHGLTGEDYQRQFDNTARIFIQDSFKRKKNADYDADEFFSDLHKTYVRNGWNGFGDFSIVGDNFEKGFRPHAVTIHLTYRRDDGAIGIRHFISDRTLETDDTNGKILEALNKLAVYVRANPMPFSTACERFLELHHDKHSPGLGYIKKLSIKHHTELMMYIQS